MSIPQHSQRITSSQSYFISFSLHTFFFFQLFSAFLLGFPFPVSFQLKFHNLAFTPCICCLGPPSLRPPRLSILHFCPFLEVPACSSPPSPYLCSSLSSVFNLFEILPQFPCVLVPLFILLYCFLYLSDNSSPSPVYNLRISLMH